MTNCPTCGAPWGDSIAPPEPPIGTWIKDRHGGVAMRHSNGNWAPKGCIPLAKWEAMWNARGPLVECPPWGFDE